MFAQHLAPTGSCSTVRTAGCFLMFAYSTIACYGLPVHSSYILSRFPLVIFIYHNPPILEDSPLPFPFPCQLSLISSS